MLSRRRLLLTLAALAAPASRAAISYPPVVPRTLTFPQDFGAHADFRTEWWYLTGWLGDRRRPLGFQLTFFRSRTDVDPANPSAFAAHQLVIAHAAIADPARGSLLLDERIARTGFGLAETANGDTDVRLSGWSLRRDSATDTYHAQIAAREFTLGFRAVANAPPWLQGDQGISRKGPDPLQASYYYSRPQLKVQAQLSRSGKMQELGGIAWLDHEWSSAALAPDAVGWDWVGMNLDDGSALAAFQIRSKKAGQPPVQTYAALRGASGSVQIVAPDEVSFTPLRYWKSSRHRTAWPVAQRIRIGTREFETRPLMDDQELDSSLTTGAVYWEGASELLEAGRPVGRGYLEMTGYVAPLQL
ncbi:MAG: carotenoid 1,2-hydratase [Chromatiales bacterium]|jgi:predicted secreted hydrolase|nr:carotenoid 1,2-hydratase [Chromatiales bacterium]